MKRIIRLFAAATVILPQPVLAWGFEGHEVVADIARAELTPAVRDEVDAILAADGDTLTKPDMASRATWADAWRSAGHRETAQWHFVDTEIDGSADVNAACFGHPAAATPASDGPAEDCVVDKVQEFATELSAPATSPAERLLALKYLLHFVGDLHQPLHASDNHDRGGNCVLLSLGGPRTQNLHAYWDTAVVEAIGRDPAVVAATLHARITAAERADWAKGDATAWAGEAFQVARSVAYTIASTAGCGEQSPVTLPDGYAERAEAAAAVQLERAGVRLGALLNRSLAGVTVPPTSTSTLSFASPSSDTGVVGASTSTRSPASLACSVQADAQGLHGRERQDFRRSCIRRFS